MSVVPLTLTISLCLVFTFVLFFLREHSRRRFSGMESEALLPLAEETPRVVTAAVEASEAGARHSHGKGHECRGNGGCASCQRRAARTAAPAIHQA
jgi:hypothetical protein